MIYSVISIYILLHYFILHHTKIKLRLKKSQIFRGLENINTRIWANVCIRSPKIWTSADFDIWTNANI